MITIHKAIVHILDVASGTFVYSGSEIDVDNAAAVNYLSRHIEKALANPAAQTGMLPAGSRFEEGLAGYLLGPAGFVQYSQELARQTWDLLSRCEKASPVDFVLADFAQEERRGLALFLLYNKNAFTHYVSEHNGQPHVDIIRHQGLLPSGSQKAESFAIIDAASKRVVFADRKASVDGSEVYLLPELLLQCTAEPSTKTALSILEEAAAEVAEAHGKNPAVATSKAKASVSGAAIAEKPISPDAMAVEVFDDNEVLQREFAQKAKEAGLQGSMRVNPQYAVRRSRTHKIKTDTGIEITIPVEYYQNPEFVEFINSPDGSIAIQLKNINQITS